MKALADRLASIHWFDKALDLLGHIGLGLAVLVLGIWLSRRLANVFKRSLERAEIDPLLSNFLRNLLHGIFTVLLLVAALDVAGLPTASLLAALGAAGLAIGLALQGSLSNLASGVLLIIFRPFHVGEQVDVLGLSGTVERIGLMHTILISADNRVITIPNAKLASDAIVNNTARPTRRIDMSFQLAYRDDVSEIIKWMRDLLLTHEKVLREPSPEILVTSLNETGVGLAVRPWVNTEHYAALKSELLIDIKAALQKRGLTVPIPTRELRISREEALK